MAALTQKAPGGSPGSTTQNHSVTFGAAPTNGNMIVLVIAGDTALANYAAPSGFALAKSAIQSSSAATILVYWKIAGASEPTTYTITTTGWNSHSEIEGFEFSGIVAVTPVGFTGSAESGFTNVTAQQPGTTGVLATANGVVIVATNPDIAAGNNGGGEAIDSGFTVDDAATLVSLIAGHILLAATTALNPSSSWTTARRALSVIVEFKGATATGWSPSRSHTPFQAGASSPIISTVH